MLDIYAIKFYRKEIKWFRNVGRWLFCMWRLSRNLKEFKRVQMPQNENKSGVFKELPKAAARRREEKLGSELWGRLQFIQDLVWHCKDFGFYSQ